MCRGQKVSLARRNGPSECQNKGVNWDWKRTKTDAKSTEGTTNWHPPNRLVFPPSSSISKIHRDRHYSIQVLKPTENPGDSENFPPTKSYTLPGLKYEIFCVQTSHTERLTYFGRSKVFVLVVRNYWSTAHTRRPLRILATYGLLKPLKMNEKSKDWQKIVSLNASWRRITYCSISVNS